MNNLTKTAKLEFILKKVAEYKFSPEKLALKTDLTARALRKLLTGEVSNPHLTTVNQLYNFFEKYGNEIGSNSDKNESRIPVEISADDVIIRKILNRLSPYFLELKEKQDLILKLLYENGKSTDDVSDMLEKLQIKVKDMHKVLTPNK